MAETSPGGGSRVQDLADAPTHEATREAIREQARASFIVHSAEAANIRLSLRNGQLWAFYPDGLTPQSWASFENAIFDKSNSPAIAALVAEREGAA